MKNIRYIILSALLLIVLIPQASAQVTLSGYVKEAVSQENLPGAIVKVAASENFVIANEFGFYSITLPEGTYTFNIIFTGYEAMSYTVGLSKSTTYDFELFNSEELENVDFTSNHSVAEDVRMGTHQISITDIKAVPTLLGEKDVFKVLKLLPGVQKGQEGSSGLNVRGGTTDQNLIILDDAVVYNASHLFGFFSTFNGDALKGVELIKSGYPARYGERLSSVVNITMREGNKDHYTGEIGVGLLSSRATLEGPIVKNKSSFLISGRRTYADVLMQPLMAATTGVLSGYYFYDLNAKINTKINDNNNIYLSGYFGRDKFYINNTLLSNSDSKFKMKFGWGNATGTLRWNHIFNPKLFANLTVNYSNYNLGINIEESYDNNNFKINLNSSIDDIGIKYDLGYYLNNKNTLKTGIKVTRHLFRPSAFSYKENSSAADTSYENNANKYISWEYNFYIDDEWRINKNIALSTGLRSSAYILNDKSFFNIEPRLSARYLIKDLTSIKASYTIMNQYMHLLSSTGINLPTDLWVPATKSVPPQRAYQYSLGAFRDILNPNITIGLEGYYKTMDNIITYKEGASYTILEDPFNNDPQLGNTWEDNVTSGIGRGYGAELMVQKHTGKLTGWIAYTWSKIQYKFDDVNNGDWFYPRIDRRHDLNVVGFYEFSPKIKVNALFTIASGNPMSLPRYDVSYTANVGADGKLDNTYMGNINLYSERNNFRTEVYHRMDLGIMFMKEKRRGTRTWEISVYNIYNRKNPFFYTLEYNSKADQTSLYKYAIFPIIPSISYSFKFK